MNWKFWKKQAPVTVAGNLLTLLPEQRAFIEALDTRLAAASPGVPNVPYAVEAVVVPMLMHGLPPHQVLDALGIKQRPYMPRSVALFTQPHGDWLVLIGWRDPAGESTELEKALFARLLVQTNAVRDTE